MARTCAITLASTLALLLAASASQAASPVIVHEWGTFTSLQDDQGHALGGINVDEEPVPHFVHNIGGAPVVPQYSYDSGNLGLPPYALDKAWVNGDPTVTMRLETPVIYLYPPKGQTPQSVPPLTVHVDFHGGVLSQYYPYADTTGLPLYQGASYFVAGLTTRTTTGLTWKDIRLGATTPAITTDDKVWTTPREVSAPLLSVRTPYTSAPSSNQVAVRETEHFLFYRGIGHLDSPVCVKVGFRGKTGTRMPYLIGHPAGQTASLNFSDSWLVDIRPDGSCAYSAVTPIEPPRDFFDLQVSAKAHSFYYPEYSAANLAALKSSMQSALVKAGLYPDEASAMLRTWELSYFKSPGLRFFYLVPRAWTDQVLPLKITGAPAQITRVMIGRIELITDTQRAALARLASGPCPDLPALKQAAQRSLEHSRLSRQEIDAFYHGEKPLTDLGIPLPPLASDYLSLGRFRDALIVHENQEHPTPALAQFIQQNQLAPGTH